jgi:hypothetical protein
LQERVDFVGHVSADVGPLVEQDGDQIFIGIGPGERSVGVAADWSMSPNICGVNWLVAGAGGGVSTGVCATAKPEVRRRTQKARPKRCGIV